jgi:uncharacterized RDD family membrane protein YckC
MNEAKCAQCGTPATPGDKFCETCGAAIPSQVTQGVASAEPTHRYAAAEVPAQYQGVAIRFVAILIDLIIIGIIATILSVIGAQAGAYPATVAIGVVISLLYFILLLGRSGQTIGMMVVKIRVVKEADYSPIGYAEAAIRTILLYIDEIPFVIPYLLGAILIWTSEKKQRLGDRAAHTVVVKA